ncbi:MAG: hypothetical protein K8R21_15375 [Leptospira sp.]|nr:hypothetical protein [Leptospira sp.]
MQRWVTNDLAGYLIETGGTTDSGGEWTLLSLPAINSTGDPLWPEKFPIELLLEQREVMGEQYFSAMFQQIPVDIQDRIFQDPKYAEPPAGIKLHAYFDPAFGGSDFCSIAIGGTKQENDDTLAYIVRGEIWKSHIDKMYDRVEKICRDMNVTTITIETNQAQVLIAHELRKRGLTVREKNNTSNKHIRIMNFLKVPWSKIRFSKMVQQEFINQILSYNPVTGHDDAPDASAGLMQVLGLGSPDLSKRFDYLKVLTRRIIW